jgi:flagellar protein FlbD
MIQLTRLNHLPLILNSDLIEHIEVAPDTVIALTSGHTFVVLESAEEVVEKIVQFRRLIHGDGPTATTGADWAGHPAGKYQHDSNGEQD